MNEYVIKWASRDIPDSEKNKFSHVLIVVNSEIQAKCIVEEENAKQNDVFYWYEQQ